MSQFIQVFGRIKPSGSVGDSQAIEQLDKNRIRCQGFGGKEARIHELHRFFAPTTPQNEVFTFVAKKLVEDSTKGINVTIFAYGQTGSGKTHTMLGPSDGWSDPETKGLIPRSIEHLFNELEKKSEECQKFTFSVVAQFVEIYNEVIYDLLGNSQNKVTLRDTGLEIQLVDAQCETVSNSLDLMHVVKRGWESRRTGETAMNRDSSRSHALLILKINTEEVNGSMLTTRQSTLSLVDLAGSERQSQSKAQGERLKEAANINSSLSVLGRCIRLLANPNCGNAHVPYRESHLTHILKNSLGGNSKTAVIVNMHSDRLFLAETTSTLMFASACSMIKNKVIKNETMSGDTEEAYKMAIRNLHQEMDLLESTTRAECAKKIEESEINRKEWYNKAMDLKEELDGVRAKYNVLLFKSGSGESDSSFPNEVKPSQSTHPLWGSEEVSIDQLRKQIETLTHELRAKQSECETLSENLADERSRKLNESISLLRTPRTNRKSTRNLRRDTMYIPSPGRHSDNHPDDLSIDVVENWELKYQECEVEKQEIQAAADNHIKMLEEKFLKKAKDSTAMQKELKNQLYDSDETNKKLQMENDEMAEKIGRNKVDVKRLVGTLTEKDNHIQILEKSKKELIERFTKQIEDSEEYHRAEMIKLKEKHDLSLTDQMNEELEKLSLVMRQKDDKFSIANAENNQIIDILKSENANKQAEIDSLREQTKLLDELKLKLEQMEKEIVEKESESAELKRKAVEVQILQSEMQRRDEKISELAEMCKSSKQIIEAKDETICGLEKIVADTSLRYRQSIAQYSQLQQEVVAGKSLQLKYEEACANEQSLKNQVEELRHELSARFREHNVDIKNMKNKYKMETEDVKNTLEMERRLREDMKKQSEKDMTERSRKFDEKMDNFRKTFQQTKIDEIKEQEEELRREFDRELNKVNKSWKDKTMELENKIEALNKLRDEDSAMIEEKLGHGNRGQKLNYLGQCRARITHLEVDNKQLREQLLSATTDKLREPVKSTTDKLREPVKSTTDKLREPVKSTTDKPPRVLRSRNVSK